MPATQFICPNGDKVKFTQGGEFGDLNSFYGLACSLTLSREQGGIVSVKIIFIEHDEEY